MEGRALSEAIENALRALFCEKNGFKMTCRHLRDLQGYCVYTSGVFFFFSPRYCVAPIALMDKPPLCVCVCVCELFKNVCVCVCVCVCVSVCLQRRALR